MSKKYKHNGLTFDSDENPFRNVEYQVYGGFFRVVGSFERFATLSEACAFRDAQEKSK